MKSRTLWLVGALLMMLPGIGQAQTPQASTAAVTSRALEVQPLRAIIPATQRLSKRVVLIVDGSGSMTGQIGGVLDALNTIATQSIEDMDLAVVMFRGKDNFPGDRSFTRWPGIRETGLRKGWARLPSAFAPGVAEAWVNALGASGGTDPADALEHAITIRLDRLSVVFVSDGVFDEKPVLKRIKLAQRRRRRAGFGRAVVAVFGIGTNAPEQKSLKAIAHAGSGGFWIC